MTSILTFNCSVSDKNNLTTITDPYQIMPATQNMISDKTISNYPTNYSNENLLLHMNYITRIFKSSAIEYNSRERYSLKQYVKLAKRLGTKDILIHMPCSRDELNNLGNGFKLIQDEIIKQGMNIHLEITAWNKDLMAELDIKHNDAKEYICNYLTEIIKYYDVLRAPEQCFIVIDTAHLYSNGCSVDDMIYIIDKFKGKIKYIHMNGNNKPQYTSDTHAPLFTDANRIQQWDKLSRYCAKLGVICITENNKFGAEWDDWKKYAEEYGFKLVEFNDAYSY